MSRRLLVVTAVLALAAFAPGRAVAAPVPAGATGIALDGAVDLAWQTVAGATAYNVYRGTSPTTINTLISPVGGVAATGFSDATAVNGTTYYYAVKPIVAGSESGSSSTVQATPRVRSCSTGNPVVLENCFSGSTGWKVQNPLAVAAGGIEGFAAATSVNRTGSVDLKVTTAGSTTFDVEIYRSGYYGGPGGRLVSTILSVPVGAQPSCTSDAPTGLYDCSNWSTSLTLTTSTSWPSGVYLIRLVRDDNGSDTELVLAVRDDARSSDLLFGVPFSTYQAYNNYGGKSLYTFNSTGVTTVAGTPRAVKVSFDRPFVQPRDPSRPDWYTRSDYPLVYWLERSGYDVAYTSVTDLERRSVGSHAAYVSGAHDEYWSAPMRSALEQARAAGTSVVFGGSNAIYWRIRFENGPNGGQDRIEVCYKSVEGVGAAVDPVSSTSTWRDPAGPNNPENALIGQLYVGDKDGVYFPLVVSAAEGTDRIWRYTGLDAQAPGSSTSIGTGLVGWEWDKRDTTNGFEPTGVKSLATSPATGNLVQNYGGNYVTGSTTSNVTKYKAASGALVFATGTNHWARGLALTADGLGEPDLRIQQATTNVFADMGASPQTPAANITLDSATAPRVTSTSPTDAATNVARTTTVTATFSRAMDGSTITGSSFTLKKPDGSAIAATVSYNAGTTTATLTPNAALDYSTTYTARLATTVKATDGTPLQFAATWTFTTLAQQLPVRVNAGGAAYTTGDGRSFAADTYFTGGSTNTTGATITGTSDPKLYQDERWGQFNYAIPVVNGAYDVTFHFVEIYYTSGSCVGKRIFSMDILDTTASPDVSNVDACALAGGANKAAVVTVYGVNVNDGFLNVQSVYGAADDPEVAAIEVVPSTGPPPAPTVTAQTPASGATGVATGTTVTATFSRAMNASTITSSSFTLTGPGGPVSAAVSYNSATNVATLTPSATLANSTSYTAKLATTIKAQDGTPLASAVTWSFTTAAAGVPAAVRVNSGDAAYTAADGRTFLADQYFTGGSTFSSAATITGTADPALYQNERWGSFSYAIPVTSGTYDVKLHFVELYYTAGSCIGKRVFSMDVGDTAASPDVANLDVCSAAGGADKALVRTISGVNVNDGFLNIQSIYGSADDPELAAIEVVPAGPADTQPPTAPGSLAATGGLGQASLSWQASTDNVGVTKYDVYRSTTSGFTPSISNRISQPAGTSYTDTGLASGTYYYLVKAEDAAGNLSPSSNEASAVVTADTTAPTVAITAPAAGETVTGTTTVTASASDDVGVAGVQFKVDGQNIGSEDTSAPYAVSWTTSGVANGSHNLTAVARDAATNQTTSAPVPVTVANTGPAGLVAAYNFDAGSGTSAADLSGNNNTGTLANATWTTAGHSNGALSFNGTNALVSVADSASLDLSGGMTLEAWVNPSALGTAWRTVVLKEQPPGNLAYALYANTDTTRPSAHVFTSAEAILRGPSALTLNAWAHLAASYDGTTLRLYVNGTQVASTAVSGAITTGTGALKIGGNTIWSEWFKGNLDDVRVYNRALTPSEIQADMNTPVR